MFRRTVILVALAVSMAGCASKGTELTLRYQQDSVCKLPDDVKILAVSDFTESVDLDHYRGQAFKEVARDKFQLQMAKVDKQHRFDLVDRSAIEQALIEIAKLGPFPDPQKVVELPSVKTISAQALVIGKVDVESSTKRVRRSSNPLIKLIAIFGPGGVRDNDWVNVRHTGVSLTVQVINLKTHRSCIYSVTRSNDDEANSGGGDEVASDSRTLIRQLLGDCVAEAVRQMIHPEEGRAIVVLRETGSTAGISDLAVAGNYAEALEKYKGALEQEKAKGLIGHSAEAEAAIAWDAGVMCEALAGAARNPAEAETYLESAKSYYVQAINKNTQPEYRDGLARVRDRLDSAETLQRYTTSAPAKRGD